MEYPYLHLQTSVSETPSGAFANYVSTDESMLFDFGPLARVNIFVGATNSGKSRFLRELAKREYVTPFPSQQVHQTVQKLRVSFASLTQSPTALQFRVKQNNSHTFDRWAAPWLSSILKKVPVSTDLEIVYDRDFFQSLHATLEMFIDRRLNPKRGSSITSLDDLEMGGELCYALIAAEIIRENWEAEAGVYKREYGREATIASHGEISAFGFQYTNHTRAFEEDFVQFWQAFEFLKSIEPPASFTPKERIYIPTLRTAISLRNDDQDGTKIESDIFASTIRHSYGIRAYDQVKKTGLQIFTGLTLYDTLTDTKGQPRNIRQRLTQFEDFLSETFFEGRHVQITPMAVSYSKAKLINLYVEDQYERDLHNLGDGIGSLIILMYQLFLSEPESWIFIEEPELNLHPSLQRIFLQTLLNNASIRERNIKVFFTTHSNHLLRLLLPEYDNVCVFAFQKEVDTDKFLVRAVHNHQHHALALLGVENSSVLLANCALWVEGITDRIYVRAFLKAMIASIGGKRDFREDMHFAFWEYAGSNLAHYLFDETPDILRDKEVTENIQVSSLCNRVFLLADRDKSGWKAKRHREIKKLCHENFEFWVTPTVEIENLISPELLRICVPSLFKVPEEIVKDAIFLEKDYKMERLGTYLKRVFPEHCPAALVAPSGTLTAQYKNRLAHIVAERVTWDNMSKDARVLTRRLYAFIEKHNQ
jgi:hypothetical protein